MRSTMESGAAFQLLSNPNRLQDERTSGIERNGLERLPSRVSVVGS